MRLRALDHDNKHYESAKDDAAPCSSGEEQHDIVRGTTASEDVPTVCDTVEDLDDCTMLSKKNEAGGIYSPLCHYCQGMFDTWRENEGVIHPYHKDLSGFRNAALENCVLYYQCWVTNPNSQDEQGVLWKYYSTGALKTSVRYLSMSSGANYLIELGSNKQRYNTFQSCSLAMIPQHNKGERASNPPRCACGLTLTT